MQARVGFGEPVIINEHMEPKQWVGIDVSGKRLEVFVRPIQRMLKVANSPAGLATLVSELLDSSIGYAQCRC
jgi:hypothetical protein